MTGSTSGGTKTAHVRLESGGKGRWVAEEEIISGAPYDERMVIEEIFFSGVRGAKAELGVGEQN